MLYTLVTLCALIRTLILLSEYWPSSLSKMSLTLGCLKGPTAWFIEQDEPLLGRISALVDTHTLITECHMKLLPT